MVSFTLWWSYYLFFISCCHAFVHRPVLVSRRFHSSSASSLLQHNDQNEHHVMEESFYPEQPNGFSIVKNEDAKNEEDANVTLNQTLYNNIDNEIMNNKTKNNQKQQQLLQQHQQQQHPNGNDLINQMVQAPDPPTLSKSSSSTRFRGALAKRPNIESGQRYQSKDWLINLLSLPNSFVLKRIKFHLISNTLISFMVILINRYWFRLSIPLIAHNLLGG